MQALLWTIQTTLRVACIAKSVKEMRINKHSLNQTSVLYEPIVPPHIPSLFVSKLIDCVLILKPFCRIYLSLDRKY